MITDQKLRDDRTNKNVTTNNIDRTRFKFSEIVRHWSSVQIQHYIEAATKGVL